VKRRIVLIVAASVFVAGIAAFFVFGTRRTPPEAALPNPNGYDDFAAGASWLVKWNGDLLSKTPEEIRSAVNQNTKALELIHDGLRKQSAVPVRNDLNWINQHLVRVGQHKSMAQLMVGEGLVHLHEGRTNEAARTFANGIVFAHAAHHRGLMIDALVGMACQAIGAKQLVQMMAPNTFLLYSVLRTELTMGARLSSGKKRKQATCSRTHYEVTARPAP
jgi:hypothetical protein